MTITSAVTVRVANPDEAKPIADTLADAFHATPEVEWLVEHPEVRRAVYCGYSRLMVPYLMRYGTIYTTGSLPGAAVPANAAATTVLTCTGSAPEPDPTEYDNLLRQACGEHAERFFMLAATLAELHPDEPHLCYSHIGVRPAYQRRRLGAALSKHRNRIADEACLPAFRVATSPRSRDLGLRWGFHPLKAPVSLPDGGPPMWPQWREPDADNATDSNATA